MSEETATPAAEISHDAPSLPASPPPKRTKYTDPAPNLSVASILNDHAPTPTPSTMNNNTTTTPLPPHQTLPPMSFEPPPPTLQIQLLSPTAKPPTRGSAFAAGYDLYASQPAVIPARGRALVETDLAIAVPAGTYGRVAPRSGLASKHGIETGAGVIDADYRGPVKVLLFNLGEAEFRVEVGDRVAQLIVERIYTPEVVVVEQLEQTVRGAGGFGSTGGFGGSLPGVNGAGLTGAGAGAAAPGV